MVLDIPHRHSTGVQADDHRIQAVQAALTFAHQTRGEGPGPVPGHHRSQKGPTSESTILDVVPFLALPRAWVVGSPLS